jgi:hypothetical protein
MAVLCLVGVISLLGFVDSLSYSSSRRAYRNWLRQQTLEDYKKWNYTTTARPYVKFSDSLATGQKVLYIIMMGFIGSFFWACCLRCMGYDKYDHVPGNKVATSSYINVVLIFVLAFGVYPCFGDGSQESQENSIRHNSQENHIRPKFGDNRGNPEPMSLHDFILYWGNESRWLTPSEEIDSSDSEESSSVELFRHLPGLITPIPFYENTSSPSSVVREFPGVMSSGSVGLRPGFVGLKEITCGGFMYILSQLPSIGALGDFDVQLGPKDLIPEIPKENMLNILILFGLTAAIILLLIIGCCVLRSFVK